ncbi:MAG: hypothetical protein ACXV7J_13835 [Methylomonas sp.]
MLIEPVALADFFLSFFSAAMIILLGATYAGLFAWAKITAQYRFRLGAGLAYIALVIAVAVFSRINHFTGFWLALSVLMVVGYGCMPYVIWRLCVSTHAGESEHSHHSGG